MSDASLRMPTQTGAAGGGVDRVPLSFQQEFLRFFDQGGDAGPFGPRYTIVGGWRIQGELDTEVLQGALADVVARHEALRSRIVLDEQAACTHVFPASPPDLLVRQLAESGPDDREATAEEFLNEIESGLFGPDQLPLLRAVLGRFDSHDAVLVLVAHHASVDGWSAQVLIRDIAACYAARQERHAPELPPVRQYREFVAWQHANADAAATAAAREFWRENLRGAQVVPTATDRPRPAQPGGYVTGWHRFLIEDEIRSATSTLARQTRSSPFMVMLAAYLRYLHDQTGATDLVVPTFTPGRTPAWVQDTVGVFYNLLPLRTDVAGCASFRELVARVRATCIRAYPNEIPLIQLMGEAPELMSAATGPEAAASVFQAVQFPDTMYDERVGGLRYTAMRRRLRSAAVGSQIPDGVLWVLEVLPSGGIVGKVGFTSHLFDESTITGTVAEYRRVLRNCLAAPDQF